MRAKLKCAIPGAWRSVIRFAPNGVTSRNRGAVGDG